MTHDTRDLAQEATTAKVPDKGTLGLATLFAAFVAGIVLLLFVLPAEYGIDPTNFGRVTGIGKLAGGDAELDLGDHLAAVHRTEPAAPRHDTVVLTLGAYGDELEYKFHLEANQSLLYSWSSDGIVSFDFHGEPDAPTRPGEFTSYAVGEGDGASGSFQAPFQGRQGWYFRNADTKPVTITLQTWGYYGVVGQV